MIFHRMSSIFLYKRQKFSSAFLFYPKTGAHCRFSQHRLSGGTRTAQAGSPLTGGGFFAEPQRGVALCGARETAAPAAGAKRKDNLRFSFLFELLPFPYLLVWRRLPTCDRFENRGTAVGLPLRVFREIFAVHRQRTATHTAYSTQARHSSAAQFVSAL